MSLNVLLIEADHNRSLGGSCMRDVSNIYAGLRKTVPGTWRQCMLLTIDNVKPTIASRMPGAVFGLLKNYKTFFQSFIKNIVKGDSVVVMVTGHGYQQRSTTNDEVDGLDEYISFNDGIITDNDFRSTLVTPLIDRTRRTILLADTCHSGTLFDNNPKDKCIYSLAACKDNEMDSCDIGEQSGFGGALTVHLLDQSLGLSTLLTGSSAQIQALVDRLRVPLKKLGQTPLLIVPNITI